MTSNFCIQLVTKLLKWSNMKINMNPPTSSEYLSKEILEEDFFKVFSMYCLVQKIMGVSRVDVRDRFVTAPSIAQKMYTIIYVSCTIGIACIGFNIYVKVNGLTTRLYYLVASAGILILITTLCNAIHVRFLNKDDNVAFYMQMQDIDRIMGIKYCKSINKILYKIHLMTIIVILGVAMLTLTITLFMRKVLFFGLLTLFLTYGNFTLEMAYCGNLTCYFFLRIRFINAIMSNHIQAQPMNVYTTPFDSNIKLLTPQLPNFVTSDTDVYLKSIFECFFKYQNLYRFEVKINDIISTYNIKQ